MANVNETVTLTKKQMKKIEQAESAKGSLGKLPWWVDTIGYICVVGFALCVLFPLLLLVMVSITESKSLTVHGYSLFPKEFSLEAYTYLLENSSKILSSYGVTIAVTICGTVWALTAMTLFSYVISRDNFPWKSQFTFYVFFCMLFGGGLLPTYMVITNILHLNETFWILILSGSLSPMYIFMMRTYMRTSVPPSVIESASIDGAGEWRCYLTIMLPLSIPMIATIALFVAIRYWNDWNTSFLYILRNDKLVPIQLMLKRIENNLQALADPSNMSVEQQEELAKTIPTENARMALVVLVCAPILIVFPFFQKYFVKGITVGAVKG